MNATEQDEEKRTIELLGCRFEFSKPQLEGYGLLSEFFTRNHISTVLGATRDHNALRDVMWEINAFLLNQPYSYGTKAFDFAIQSPATLPIALWVCLREKQPKITPAQAKELLTPENWRDVRKTVLGLFGYAKKDASRA